MSLIVIQKNLPELVVISNPSKFEDAEDIAKESLKLYINAYRLAEIFNNCNKLL